MTVKDLGTKRLETERLILRRFTLEDAEKMYENWAGDPEVTKFLTWPTHESAEISRQILKEWVAAYDNPEVYQWCIEEKESGAPVGSIAVVSRNEKAQSCEIGYCISRSRWHKGITTEALAEVMRYLFEEVGVLRLESRHDPKNPYSGEVMKKCGMHYEGTRIRADWNNTGICDCALYGMVTYVGAGNVAQTTDSVQLNGTAGWAADGAEAKGEKQGAQTERTPKNVISDETIEYVGILAKLELDDEEKERAKKDMGEMLDYIDKLNELDTEGVEPMSHVFPVNNVFREDVVTNGDGSADTLANAPVKKDGGFKVPKTIS